MYCLVSTDYIPTNTNDGLMPIIDFSDLDRDAMTDMIFYCNEKIYTFYNRYQANPVSAEDLCKGPTDSKNLSAYSIFTPFAQSQNDSHVLNILIPLLLILIFIGHYIRS
mgnify:CR=1 FL=1